MTKKLVVVKLSMMRVTTTTSTGGSVACTCIVCSIDGEADGVCGLFYRPELEEEATVLTAASIHPVLQLTVDWGVAVNRVTTTTTTRQQGKPRRFEGCPFSYTAFLS